MGGGGGGTGLGVGIGSGVGLGIGVGVGAGGVGGVCCGVGLEEGIIKGSDISNNILTLKN